MTARVILAPVGAGKTEIALTRLSAMLDAQAFAPVWVVLPTKRQEDSFRERLATFDRSRRVIFNVEFFNFYELNRRLLDMAGLPQRDLSDTARHGILRRVVRDLLADDLLPVFQSIAGTRGFVQVVAGFINELKREGVYSADFAAAARTQKDHELALIYRQYQERLQDYRLVDVEGEGWLAVTALHDHARLRDRVNELALLVVDGFDQFTTVQADLLAGLARYADETLITLTTVPEREATAGRRFTRTLATLRDRFEAAGSALVVEQVAEDAGGDVRHPDLRHLVRAIFRRDASPRASGGGVALLEAPDIADEVAAVLRRVKRLLLDGTSPDEIMIALRDWPRYAVHIPMLAERYGVPLALHGGQPLDANPAVRTLLTLIQLNQRGFRRADVLDAMRSPYVRVPGLTAASIDRLERISLAFSVTGEAQQWRGAITRATSSVWNDYGEEEEALLDSAEQARDLWADLALFFEQVTPPAAAAVSEYVRWLEHLIGPDPQNERERERDPEEYEVEQGGYTLSMLAAIREAGVPEAIVVRDLAAMQAFKQVLRNLLAARDLLNALDSDGGPIAWAAFEEELLAAVGLAAVDARGSRSGRVLVTTATDARGLPHQHVFIAGLSEGMFPMRASEDPLYLDSEREAFKARGIRLSTQAELTADDGVFYELACLPRESLVLSRPTVQDGKPWIASHLWRAVVDVFADGAALVARDRLKIGQLVGPDAAATREEAVLAAVDGLNAFDITPESAGVVNWLHTAHGDFWGHVRAMRAIEGRRMSTQPHDRYTGRLESAALIEYAADRLGPRRVWSASQLNEFGACGFHFFAKRLLRLEPLAEPVEGMDVTQHGSLNHEILQETYARLHADRCDIVPDNLAYALEILALVADETFETAPERYNFRVTATWAQEKQVILRTLRALVQADFAAENSPVAQALSYAGVRRPFRLELGFGGSGLPVSVQLDDEIALRVRGSIDRIDRAGDAAVIIDYKSGSVEIKHDDMRDGRNFQMLLYMLAAEQLLATGDHPLPGGVLGGMFWHLTNRKTSGVLQPGDEDSREIIAQARAKAAAHVRAGRRGDFRVAPPKLEKGRCVRYCAFSRLCRIATINRQKPEH